MSSEILDFKKTEKGLRISLVMELSAILEVIELAIDERKSDYDRFIEAMEYQTCNGWNLLSDTQMDQVGIVLTSCDVFTEELITDNDGDAVAIGNYYHNIAWHQLRSPWTELITYGYVDFELQTMDEEDKAAYELECAKIEAQIDTETQFLSIRFDRYN